MNVLELCKESIYQILQEDAYINIVINDTIKKNELKNNDKSLYTKIVYGVVENKIYLDYQLKPYLKNDKLPKQVLTYLRIGCYALLELNISKIYIVSELVELVKQDFKSYVGMVNAILRNIIRNGKAPITGDKYHQLSIRYSYPINLVTYLDKMYPNDIGEILKPASISHNTYRINKKTDIHKLEAKLQELHIDYQIYGHSLITKSSINDTYFIKRGDIVNQNLSSQEVINVLNPKVNTTILDMCAAPGSKAIQLADTLDNQCDITCCDIHPHKIKLIESACKNQNITCIKTICCDASTYNFGKLYDVVMLDAPCSGLGVMKHKADLKYKFKFSDVEDIIVLQKALLGKAYTLVKKGGILIYSTCTINKEENEEMMKYFLKKHKDMEVMDERFRLPDDIYDGFYICKMKKRDE